MATAQFGTGQKLLAEAIGSATLVFVLVSSALLAHEMLGASLGVSILFVGLATAGWLFVIVEVFGPISGAHVNPAVSVALLVTGDVDARTVVQYVPVQFVGGLVGVLLANLTFVSTIPAGWEVFAVSTVERPPSTWLAEFLGTWLLASVVISSIRQDTDWIALGVGFTVGMGIIGTSSTAFLNPQVAVARIFTTAITGIRPFDAAAFVVASMLGGIAAGLTWNYLWPRPVEGSGPAPAEPVEQSTDD